MVLNISSPSSDPGVMARYFLPANFSPNGFNCDQWKDDAFEEAFADDLGIDRRRRSRPPINKAHERLVDNPPWLYIVHDLNPRAMVEGERVRFPAVLVRRSDPGQREVGLRYKSLMVRSAARASPDDALHRRANHVGPSVAYILRDAASRLLRMRI